MDKEGLEIFKKDFPQGKDFPTHYLGDKEQMYVSLKNNHSITGSDGGLPHYWKCDYCHLMYNFTDK